jgi:DNA repair protein SbcC/Rad50
MRLIELHLDRLPGLPESFRLHPKTGINLILGPNGVGKSSVCRAMGNLLWAERPGERPFSVRAVFEIDGEEWIVAREDRDAPVWTRDGEPVLPPRLPAAHLDRCYLLGLPELIATEAIEGDRELGAAMAEQLAGGYNLPRVAQEMFSSGSQAGRTEYKKWREAADLVRQLQRAQGELLRRQEGLPELLAELEYARRADKRAHALGNFKKRESRRKDADQAEAVVAEFPAETAKVRGEDPDKLADLQREIRQQTEELATLSSERSQRAQDIVKLGLSEVARLDFDRTGLEDTVRRLAAQQESCRQAAQTRAVHHDRLGVLPDGPSTIPDSLPAMDPETVTRLIRVQQRFLRHQMQVDEFDALAGEPQKTGSGFPWWLPSAAGASLLLGAAVALLFGAGPIPIEALLGAILFGAALLATGLFQRGRAVGSRPDPRLAERQAVAEKYRNAAREELASLRSELAIDLDVEDPLLADLLRISDERRRACQDLAGAEAELKTRVDQLATELGLLNAEFARLGVAEAADVSAAATRCRSLLSDRDQWETLTEADRQAARNESSLAANLERRNEELSTLSQRLGCEAGQDPLDRANRLLSDQPRWTQAVQDRDAALRDVERLTAEIATNQDLLVEFDLDSRSPDDLDRLIEAEKNAASTLEDLVRRQAELEAEIDRAIRDEALAEAMADQDLCLENLADVWRTVRENELGRMLCEDVLAQQNTDADSPLVKTARELFAEFTSGRYNLLVGSGPSEDPFLAEDLTSRRKHRLSELSDGTRTQLMLAARMAFIIQAESGPRPPLFLDQALAASDPDRFDDMARNLGRVAKQQDRQIFYLSCDPVDEAAWNRALQSEGLDPVHTIDLQLARRLAAASSLPALRPAPYKPVPLPEQLSASEYGELLGVPHLTPWSPEDAIHLFHLLRDDLPQLHRLLGTGVETLGQWRGHRNHLAASGAQRNDQAAQLEYRGQAAGALLEAWAHGRGRPVSSEWIREQEIFTATKLPEVLALRQQVDGDAEQLMAGLRNKAIKNLNKTFKDRLEEALTESGALDSREQLSEQEQLLAVRRAVTVPLSSGLLSDEEIRRLTDTLRHALETSA